MKTLIKKPVKTKVTEKPVLVEGECSCQSDGANANRIYISVAKTINLGGYESIRVEYGQGSVVEKGQSYEYIKEKLEKDVQCAILDIIEQVKEYLG